MLHYANLMAKYGLLLIKKMIEKNIKEGVVKIYEIGYLLLSSIPEEKVMEVCDSLRSLIRNKNGVMISEENPVLNTLSYTMVKKIGTQNHSFDKGYFGWFKFEISTDEIEGLKKSFESNPNILRILLITTVRENTYIGKRESISTGTPSDVIIQDKGAVVQSPTNIDEMDKSIDEMVKGA